MAENLQLTVRPDTNYRPEFFFVDMKIADSKMMGKKADFTLNLESIVHDSRPVNESKVIYSYAFKVEKTDYKWKIPSDTLNCYTYQGNQVSIVIRANLKVDDSWILKDSEVCQNVQLKLVDTRAATHGNAETEIDPFDNVHFGESFNALSHESKILFVVMSVICSVVAVGGSLLLWAIIASDETIVAIVMIVILLVVICFLWGWLKKKIFSSYMRASLRQLTNIDWDTKMTIPQLVTGVSRVDLKFMTMRVVACNMEKGQYVRGHGTNRRTVSFEEPIRPVILYSETAPHIPKNQEIASYFPGEVDFGPMFKALYPPLEISSTHGLTVYWEIQLIHNELVDFELKGPANQIVTSGFFVK